MTCIGKRHIISLKGYGNESFSFRNGNVSSFGYAEVEGFVRVDGYQRVNFESVNFNRNYVAGSLLEIRNVKDVRVFDLSFENNFAGRVIDIDWDLDEYGGHTEIEGSFFKLNFSPVLIYIFEGKMNLTWIHDSRC